MRRRKAAGRRMRDEELVAIYDRLTAESQSLPTLTARNTYVRESLERLGTDFVAVFQARRRLRHAAREQTIRGWL